MEEEIAEVVRQYGWYAASISDHRPLQPRLDIGLTPEERRRWRRQWE